MSHDHLSDFLTELERSGELRRVHVEVDPVLEIAEITRRVNREPNAPALFFSRVKGSTFPVVTNLLGTVSRMCRALSVRSFEEVADRITRLIQPQIPQGILETLRLVPEFSPLMNVPPKLVKTALSQQVVKLGRDINLREFPFLLGWPEEEFPVITSGQVFTQHPETRGRNVGLYPLKVLSPRTLAMSWDEHCDGWQHFQHYRREGQPMPIAIALGGDPLMTYIAQAPLPEYTDELLLGGFLRNKAIELVKARTIDMEVPADAEIIIEGQIDPGREQESVGLIGLRTGHYSLPRPAAVIQVTGVTHRSNPVLPAMITGAPPSEWCIMEQATERIFLPMLKLFIPELVDLHRPASGMHRSLLFVSIRKSYPGQARKVMHSLWGVRRLLGTKICVVVDSEVPVHNEEEVWKQVATNCHPGRDILITQGPTLLEDHATPVPGLGEPAGIDATRKLPGEGHPRPWPNELAMPVSVVNMVSARWREYGIK